VALRKKWYNLFVVSDGPAGRTDAPASGPQRRVDEVAPEPPAALAPDASVTGAGTIADVYEAARIPVPSHGYTVMKVAEMLQSGHIRALPPEVKRKSILVALDAAGVSVDEVVRDAVLRDQALDTYERVLEQHLEAVRAEQAADNARLEDEIAQRLAELRGRIDENNRAVSHEQDELREWRARKHQEEQTIAEAVSYFVTDSPITTTPPPVDAKGESDVR
jgi:Asp-tRNA(Asn)/Glu-tRNA(Gln) amidotransferase A subunit family amidase